jgi:peptidyl-prolyl cis-trans isomerase D
MIRFLQSSGKATKTILGGMLLLICGAMVITLVPGGMLGDAFGFGGVQQGVLAKVGNEEVSVTEVDTTAQRLGQMRFGTRPPAQLMPYLRQAAAEQLITQRALLVEAERMGFKVTDAELRDALTKGQIGQMLFPNGQFVGQPQYEQFVNQQFNMSVPQFEQLYKNDLVVNKLRAAIEGPVNVSKQEIEQEFKRENTKVKFDYAILSADDLMKQVKPTEAELKTFYDSHKQNYVDSIPEKRQVKYAVIDSGKLSSTVQVTQSDLQSYYRDHQEEYRVPEQVNASHILVKTPAPGPDGKVDDTAVKAAKQKAEDLLAKVKSGANFAELAKKNSDDPGSAQQGGSLGWVNRGQMVPEFEKAAFALKKGETSGLVQSSYGFHIIRLDDRHEARLKPLDEVKSEIEPIVRQQKAQTVNENISNKIASQAKTQGLEKTAQANNLDVLTSNYVTRTDTLPGVGLAPNVMDAIFSAGAKDAPDSASTQNGSVIFQVTDIRPPATPSFDEIRARVESEFKADRAQQLLGQKTQELAEKAKAEHDLKKAAKQVGATVKTSELVTLNSQVPELGRMSDVGAVAFTLNKGEISGAINTGRGGAVLMLLDKQEPSPEEIARNTDQTRETLASRKRDQTFQIFATALRQRMEADKKIRRNQAEWDRIMKAAPDAGQ